MALRNHAKSPGRETFMVAFYNLKKERVEHHEFDTEPEAIEYAELAAKGNLEDIIVSSVSIAKMTHLNNIDIQSKFNYRH